MIQQMETFSARLASFDRVLYPEKRRSSSGAPASPVAWPHSRPSPAELAHAGFFYNPYETNPDNTTCFLCNRALDGWEEDDNPITEHLKHTKDCGWAIMMDIQQHSSNPAEIEDPTSEWVSQARQATFGDSWPHDGKRGWVCQSDKMVEGGWYFCPNEESNDLATCPYCKLSLDGWEPKDVPFDEHYRRSSDCSFFVFAKPAGKKGKGTRSKKPRVSKASSRLSTQSTVSEAPVPELDDLVDPSTLPQPTTKAKSSKKSSKSKTKGTKSKKEDPTETVTQMDIDTDHVQPEPAAKAKRAARGKKRTSDEVHKDEAEIADAEPVEGSEPPAKKRATKSRNSTLQDSHLEDAPIEEAPLEEKPKKSRATSKKKTNSKSRKISTESSVSKAPSTSEIPPHSELEAAVEADLDLDKTNDDEMIEAPLPKAKKSKSKKKAKAAPEPPNNDTEHNAETDPQITADQDLEQLPEPEPSAEEEQQIRRTNKRKSARASAQGTQEPLPQESPQTVTHSEPEVKANEVTEVRRHESFVSVEIPAPIPTQKADGEQPDKDSKCVKRKASSEKQRKSKQADRKPDVAVSQEEQADTENEVTDSPEEEKPESPQQVVQEETQEQTPDEQSARRRSSRVPPKTAERYSDIPKEKQFAKSLAETRNSHASAVLEDDNQSDEERPEPDPVSPLPSPSKSTSLSPQSSDAENQPPSLKPTLKPSVSRAPVASPSKQARIPLATSTPSPSKRGLQTNISSLNTSHPWTPVDIDGVVVAGTSDKENIDFNSILNSAKGELTSPEKKMSVEEWIKWNAKNGEEKLKRECERLVSQFEREGARAMHVLEGIECID
ncbi:hypothetical protein BO70DRAFT_324562 [Aspergillus heteromorphus CBS 117.55]|uniref:Chromosome segregation protein BIR1 n=1 Tax=Aspergillus heteromorphus CBS 117.55 TaxID=1448321 RepID=A0A317UUP1_9EURO|nr:uncharacterized protein BO70DRAFT_324562 [Aspergillus heteromorphus CBS 117.55]PWY65714.1 hypothetical protein BO70DRAFT_324562 [Aspergillus heteromorphus CBS 117.55]